MITPEPFTPEQCGPGVQTIKITLPSGKSAEIQFPERVDIRRGDTLTVAENHSPDYLVLRNERTGELFHILLG